MDRAVVIHPNFPPGRRIVAVSDIHGNLPFFRALLGKIALTPEDILVLVGDLLEKGQESLTLLRYVMDLCRTHTVYPLFPSLSPSTRNPPCASWPGRGALTRRRTCPACGPTCERPTRRSTSF